MASYISYLRHGITWSNNKSGNRAHSDSNGKFVSAKYGYKYEKVSNLSDEELKRRNQRRQNEKKYEKLYNPGNAISELGSGTGELARAVQGIKIKGKKGPKADLSQYSDQELQRIINRARNEAEYDRIFNPEVESKGQKFVNGLGTVLSLTTGALVLAGAGYGLYRKIKG